MNHELNINQQKAINAPLGPVVVIAGAGTGKTRVLTSRIVHLIEEHQFNAYEILAITFTNKAATEMKNRIRTMLPNTIYNNFCTFHAICLKILKEDIGCLKRKLNFRVIDEEEKEEIISEIIYINNLRLDDGTKAKTKQLVNYICNIKSNEINLSELNDIRKINQLLKIHN
jgi:DNA helicase-2/ATP-dependent DNA helicase PcrA